MVTVERRIGGDEVARLGGDVYRRVIRPKLRPDDEGKYVAVDALSGEYEVDADDYAAIDRLLARVPGAAVWLECAGYPTAYRL